MQTVIALVWLKTALADEHTQGGYRSNLQPRHAVVIGAHVGFADEHRAQAKRTQIVSHGPLTNGQRYIIPGGAMTKHVAPSIEGHPRWSTDWRLAIGAGEIDTPGSQGVDMRRVQGRMAVATHIVSPELVTHDEENVAYGTHGSTILPHD